MHSKNGELANLKIKLHDGSFEDQPDVVQQARGKLLLVFEKGNSRVYTVKINMATVDGVTKGTKTQ